MEQLFSPVVSAGIFSAVVFAILFARLFSEKVSGYKDVEPMFAFFFGANTAFSLPYLLVGLYGYIASSGTVVPLGVILVCAFLGLLVISAGFFFLFCFLVWESLHYKWYADTFLYVAGVVCAITLQMYTSGIVSNMFMLLPTALLFVLSGIYLLRFEKVGL